MSKLRFFYALYLLGCIFLTSCECNKPKSISNDINKIRIENKTADKFVLKSQWNIKSMVGIKDGSLICKSNNNENIYYVLNSQKFSLGKTFGVRGNGKDEWNFPNLLLSQEKGVSYVIDNGKRKITVLRDYSISEIIDSPIKGIVNNPKMYGKYLCYSDENPDKIVFRLNDFKTCEPLDSVEFEDDTHKGCSYLHSFVYDNNDKTVVLAHTLKDSFEIYSISPDSHLQQICEVKGDGLADEKKNAYYYSAVIDENKIYLLSQRHVDIKSQSGYSSIEVYGLDGKALRNIRLDFIASQMRMNPENHTLLLLSETDGSINVMKL